MQRTGELMNTATRCIMLRVVDDLEITVSGW
jgi:hypothetical protein